MSQAISVAEAVSVTEAPAHRGRPSGSASSGQRLFVLPPPSPAATMPLVVSVSPSDGELIERIGAGDRSAFEQLYQRYSRPIFALALRRLSDRGRAEDAVQEAFTSVWRSAATYRRERGAGAHWLYAVARNAIVDRGRSQREPAAEPPDEPSPDPGPAETTESDWTAWRLHRAVAALPERERTVIELAYWGGLSQSEIAERIGAPLGTVKTRTRSALSRLADLVEEELQ
jgi:RNA polymerase sigma-70 factor, ECF subfamily